MSQHFFDMIRLVHIVAGAVVLLSGLAAILLRRKLRYHRKAGKIYFAGMSIIFVSSCMMSFLHKNVFLFCVGCFTYYSCLTAYRALGLKKITQGQQPGRVEWAIEWIFGSLHILFLLFALMLMFSGQITPGIISAVFGLLGIRANYATIQRLKGKAKFRNDWLLAHIGGMLGSYIGAITAFTVNNERVLPLHPLLLWLGPAALLVPLMILELRKHRGQALHA